MFSIDEPISFDLNVKVSVPFTLQLGIDQNLVNFFGRHQLVEIIPLYLITPPLA